MADNYGSADGVATLARSYTNKTTHKFDADTNPTLDEVESWLDQVTSILNAELAQARFNTPITEISVTPMLDMFVNKEVAALVFATRSRSTRGPLGSTGAVSSVSDRFSVISGNAKTFVVQNAEGISHMGAARSLKGPRFGVTKLTRVDSYS